MNVVSLPEHGPRSIDEPDAEIIKMCEDALEHAKSGRMRACAITWVGADGFSNNWATAATRGITLLGAMTLAVHTWAKRMDD